MTNDEKLMQQLDAMEKLASQTPTTHVRAGKAQFDGKEHIALWFDDCSDPIQQATYINATKPEKLKKFLQLVRARLAQPEQEPVAWMHPDGRLWTFGRGLDKSTFTIPLYAAPPQREWQGLTDEEIMELVKTWHGSITLASAVEAKLKAKNAT